MPMIPREAYPLDWPEGVSRTPSPDRSRFKTGFGAARVFLNEEVARMGGTGLIISTNVPLRNDGQPRSGMPEPRDKGVAVYFRRKGKDMSFPCDKWDRTQDNIYSIAKTIEALRGIERWGTHEMMERAYTGFSALPAKATSAWREVLNVPENATMSQVDTAFRELARKHHPDTGDKNEEMFGKVIQAREDARKELGATL